MDIKRFDPIITDIPYKQIYSRLGYVNGKTKLNSAQQKQVEQLISRAASIIELKGCAVEVRIEQIKANKIVFEHDFVIESSSLVKLLNDCQSVLFMASTAGQEIIQEINSNTADSGDMTQAVIYDAAAGEMTDAGLDWIVNFYNTVLRRQNKTLTKRRFSAGYGDLDIKNQKIFYDVLKLDQLNISLNKSFLLVPEKSVTALAGIKAVQ